MLRKKTGQGNNNNHIPHQNKFLADQKHKHLLEWPDQWAMTISLKHCAWIVYCCLENQQQKGGGNDGI